MGGNAANNPLTFASRIGYEFRDSAVLKLALTHRSWCAENPGHQSNERLEFLGDSVLGLAVTDHLMERLPDTPEGDLAKIRAGVVSAPALARVACQLGLGDDLLLGRGEAQSGGSAKPSILADALEAVLGAVYLDGGWPVAQSLAVTWLADRIDEAVAGPGVDDFKTRLQERVARQFESAPVYQLSETGPEHEKRFFATVSVDGKAFGRGEGKSKKQAEQDAARRAWDSLTSQSGAVEEAGRPHA